MSELAVPPLNQRDPERIGAFTLLGRLGEGGMGTVYLAERPDDDELVALKVIRSNIAANPDFVRRFAREVRSVQAVSSARVAAFIDSGIDDGVPWLAIRYHPGLTLKSWVEEHGPLDAEQVSQLATGLLEGLHDIHSAGFVHRDLKPSNVLLHGGGPVIIDFGVAIATDETSITRTGLTIGSPGWMAPEQVSGEDSAAATDVFSWACVVQYAAMGSSPFGRGRPDAQLYRVLHAEPSPHNIVGPLGTAVDASLAKDPAMRPTLARIQSMLAGTPTSIEPFTRLDLPIAVALPPREQKSRIPLVVSTVVATIALGAAIFFLNLLASGGTAQLEAEAASTAGAVDTQTVAQSAPPGEIPTEADIACQTGSGPIRVPLLRATGEDDDVRQLVGSLWPGTQFSAPFSAAMRDMTSLPDGRVAGVTFENTVVVWDPANPLIHRTNGEPLDATTWVVAAVGTSTAAVGTDDGVIRLFDAASPTDEPRELRWHEAQIRALVGLCDGRVAASSKFSNTATLWDPTTDDVQLIEDPVATIGALARIDETRLVAGNDAGIVRIWDTTNLDAGPLTLNGSFEGVVDTVVVLDSGIIVAVDAFGVAQAWAPDSTDSLAIRTLGSEGFFGATSVAVPGGRFAIGQGEGSVRLWHPASDRVVELEAGRPVRATTVEFGDENRELIMSNDGRLIAVSTDDVMRIWPVGETVDDTPFTLAPAAVVAVDPDQRTGGNELAWLGDGRFLAAGRALRTFSVDATIASSAQPSADISALEANGDRFVVGRIDGRVSLFDGDALVIDSTGDRAAVAAVALLPQGFAVASNPTGGSATVEVLAPGEDTTSLATIPDTEITAMIALSRQQVRRPGMVAVGTADGRLLLVTASGIDSTFTVAESPVLEIVELEDGRLAVGTDESMFLIVDPVTVRIEEVDHPFGSPTPMALWRGQLVTAGGNGRVRLWDISAVSDLAEPLLLESGAGRIIGLAAGDAHLAIADESGRIVWIDDEGLVRATRELDRELLSIAEGQNSNLFVTSATGVSALTTPPLQ